MTTIYVTREVRCWVSGVPPMIGFWSERNKRAHQFSLDSSRKTLRCSNFSGSDVLFRNQTVYTSCASCSLAIPVATLHLLRHVNFYFLFFVGEGYAPFIFIHKLIVTHRGQSDPPAYIHWRWQREPFFEIPTPAKAYTLNCTTTSLA